IFAIIGWVTVLPVYILALAALWRFANGRVSIAAARPIETAPATGSFGYDSLPQRRLAIAFLLAPVLYFTLVHMIFVGSVRYRVPVMPTLYIFAGAAVASVLTRRAGPDRPPSASPRETR